MISQNNKYQIIVSDLTSLLALFEDGPEVIFLFQRQLLFEAGDFLQ